jgi:hypothetical protein
VDPLYGESLTVTGASVLHLAVSAKGSVEKVDVIRELGDLTASTVEAVKKWKLLAAVDKAGNPVESDAFAVCVYRPLERRGTQDSQSARAVSQVSKSYGIS